MRNRFAKRMMFLSILFELWKFEFFLVFSLELFQVISLTESVREKVEFLSKVFELWNFKIFNVIPTEPDRKNFTFSLKQVNQALNLSMIKYYQTRCGFLKRLKVLSKIIGLRVLKLFKLSDRRNRLAKTLNCLSILLELWNIETFHFISLTEPDCETFTFLINKIKFWTWMSSSYLVQWMS